MFILFLSFLFALGARTWNCHGDCNPWRLVRLVTRTWIFRTSFRPHCVLKVSGSRTHRAPLIAAGVMMSVLCCVLLDDATSLQLFRCSPPPPPTNCILFAQVRGADTATGHSLLVDRGKCTNMRILRSVATQFALQEEEQAEPMTQQYCYRWVLRGVGHLEGMVVVVIRAQKTS
jgi:hypothetical protein